MRKRARDWALMFFFTACGSFFGGTFHGFGGEAWWKLTVYSIGLASLCLLLPFLRVVAIAIFIVYAFVMVTHDNFGFVIADYGLSLLILSIVMIVRWSPASPWVLAGVAVSVIAAVVQQSPLPEQNAIYHVIQLVALWLLFKSAGRDRSTIRPT